MGPSNRILVIEPDATTRRRYVGWLKTEGFDVEATTNESDALGALRRDSSAFRLVLAAIKSTKERSLIEHLLAVRPDLPVVAIAADNRASVAAIEQGAWHCLVRPVEEELLSRMIALVMKLWPQRSATTHARRARPRPSAGSVSATEAKNEFATLLERAVARGPVFITKHDEPRAVLLALEEFNALTAAPDDRLSVLAAAFDELLDRMQRPGSRARMQAAFDASPDELGEAAVRAARQS